MEVLVLQGEYNVLLSDDVTSANVDKSHLVTTSQNFPGIIARNALNVAHEDVF